MLTPLASSVFAALPSPSFNTISLGPVTLRLYGLCIALGVIAAVVISSKRWKRGAATPTTSAPSPSGPCPPG